MTSNNIKNNKRFLKTILTTASTLAIAMGAASETGAAAVAVNMSGLGAQPNGTITQLITGNPNNWAVFDAVGQNLVFDAATNLAGAFMTKSGTMTVTNSVTIGAISNGGAGGTASITVADGKTLTFNGGTYGAAANYPGLITGGGNYDYGAVGSVVLGTTNTGAATTLTIAQAPNTGTPTLYFPINSVAGAAHPGILNSSGGLLYNGAIGGNAPLSAINVTNDGNFQTWLTSAAATNINLMDNASAVRLGGGIVTANIVIVGDVAGATNAVNVTGGTTLTGNIGTTTLSLTQLNIPDNITFTINGNIYATNTKLSNAGANLTIIGGTVGSEKQISTAIKGTDAAHGQGTVTVGNGTIGRVHFKGELGNTNNLQLLTVSDGSSATLFEDATFKPLNAGALGSAGIKIGDAATVTIMDTSTLTLSGNASINGSANGKGTAVFVNQNVPKEIGETHPLMSIRLHQYVGGPHALAHAIHATTLDITGGTQVTLDDNVSVTNITGGIISSDNSSTTFSTNPSAATYSGASNTTLNIGNLGVMTHIAGKGTLSALSAIPDQTNKVIIDFSADGIFETKGDGEISGISTNTNNQGTFKSTANTHSLDFSGIIGADNTHYLKKLTLLGDGIGDGGAGSASANINLTPVNNMSHIYAQTIEQNGMKLDSTASNLTMHSTNYNITNGAFEIGNKTITATGTVTLAGNIIINANFVDTNHIALDLSGASLDGAAVTNLVLNVTNNTMPNRNTIMKMISPAQTTIAKIPSNANITVTSPDGKWVASEYGSIIYNPLYPSISTNTSTSTGLLSTLSPNFISNAASFGGNVNVAADGSLIFPTNTSSNIPGARPGQLVLDIFGANIISISTLPSRIMGQFPTTESRINMQQDLGKIFSANPDGFVTQGTASVLAATMAADNRMPAAMAAIIINPSTGAATDLIQNMIKVAGIKGSDGANKMYADLTTPPTNTALTIVTNRINSTTNQAGNGAQSSSVYSDESSVYADESGVAAGDSPYDKFGVWGSINAGNARQKLNKDNPGFRSFSKGFAIGSDTMINDRTSLGFTVSNSLNHMKHRDSAAGNLTDSSSWVGAIYGNRQLKNNWFIRGTGLFNRTHINNKALRLVPTGSGIAQAKYNAISYGGEVSIGFDHIFNNQMIATPSLGVRMIHSNKTSYAEQGNTAQNSSVVADAMNNYHALAGLSVSKNIVVHGINLTPEAHVNVQYGLNMQNPKGAFISPLTPTLTTSFIGTKSSKVTSTYGLSLTGSQDRFEVGINGDVSISDKYVGYTGSLKLKVKF